MTVRGANSCKIYQLWSWSLHETW